MQRYIELGRCVTFIYKPVDIFVPQIPRPRLMGLPPRMPTPVPFPPNATFRKPESVDELGDVPAPNFLI